eukprot:scaffold8662_cov93-Skeletonema_dohrnii-CCMP3373.AAC.1
MAASWIFRHPLQLAMIAEKLLLHGSSIICACQRRYNVEGDLMRHLRWPRAPQLTAISSHTVNMAINSSSDPLQLAMIA